MRATQKVTSGSALTEDGTDASPCEPVLVTKLVVGRFPCWSRPPWAGSGDPLWATDGRWLAGRCAGSWLVSGGLPGGEEQPWQ